MPVRQNVGHRGEVALNINARARHRLQHAVEMGIGTVRVPSGYGCT